VSSLQPVRGTHDLMFDDIRRHRHIEATAWEIAQRYGYSEIATPVFEFTEVFTRTLGDTSDIVTKEMYTFETKGGESITLRPEGTAGVARAFITGGLAQQTPLKFFYRGPMFRHERPQKGRQRQFHQIGVELIGVAGPQADVEVITMGKRILDAFGIANVTLQLNSLGDAESRARYREILIRFLENRKDQLSVESLGRLSRNPLRVLDSKDPGDQAATADAPKFIDYLNEQSRNFFETVKEGLYSVGVQYTLNPKLVRGLDYYSHTAFEFVSGDLGAQSTVLAGGRYDGLIKDMGGPQTPGIGWAAGVERLAMLSAVLPDAQRPIAVVPIGDVEVSYAAKLADTLRHEGLVVEFAFSGNTGKRMKMANKVNARLAVLIGANEVTAEFFTIKNLDSGEQFEFRPPKVKQPFNELADYLRDYR
jgi:histidyl-tRNA synthetase